MSIYLCIELFVANSLCLMEIASCHIVLPLSLVGMIHLGQMLPRYIWVGGFKIRNHC